MIEPPVPSCVKGLIGFYVFSINLACRILGAKCMDILIIDHSWQLQALNFSGRPLG
jgi:hypothetical protein